MVPCLDFFFFGYALSVDFRQQVEHTTHPHPQNTVCQQPLAHTQQWSRFSAATLGWAVEGRLLGENGVWGPIFMISATNATLGFSRPSVAPMLDGGFAVAFVDGGEVFLRLLHSDGSPVGPPVMANTHTLGTQNDPAVAVLDNGNVAVAWASRNQAGAESAGDIYLKVFDPQGASAPVIAFVDRRCEEGCEGVDCLLNAYPFLLVEYI